jgi:hypothetical protein
VAASSSRPKSRSFGIGGGEVCDGLIEDLLAAELAGGFQPVDFFHNQCSTTEVNSNSSPEWDDAPRNSEVLRWEGMPEAASKPARDIAQKLFLSADAMHCRGVPTWRAFCDN